MSSNLKIEPEIRFCPNCGWELVLKSNASTGPDGAILNYDCPQCEKMWEERKDSFLITSPLMFREIVSLPA